MGISRTGRIGVKKVLAGLATIGSGSISQVVTVETYNLVKSELRMLGFKDPSGTASQGFPHVVKTNSTTITASRSAVTGNICEVSWELTINW